MFPRFISVKTHCFHQKILSLHYQIKYSPITSNLFTRPPVNLPRYPVSNIPCPYLNPLLLPELVNLLPCLLSQATCSPVYSSTCQLAMLLPELVHLLPCLLTQATCSPVYSSTCQLAMLLPELVHLLPCLLSQATCSPVNCQLVHQSTRQLVNSPCYSPNLFICYSVFFHKQLVNSSTRQPVNLHRYPVPR